jgi:hypothetical protein
MVWQPARPVNSLPPNRAAELIGRPPDHRSGFDVEAAVEGLDFSRFGRAAAE